ncbi:MAG: CopG family transcriptional regulator [Desulfobacterium sp.]|nr:CopG family transcriptional regulator [Desulfobacterium sp.]
MTTAKIAITIDQNTLTRLDLLVKSNFFPNRSRAIQEAVAEKLERIEKTRLPRECAKLNPEFEQDMAEEGFETEIDENQRPFF